MLNFTKLFSHFKWAHKCSDWFTKISFYFRLLRLNSESLSHWFEIDFWKAFLSSFEFYLASWNVFQHCIALLIYLISALQITSKCLVMEFLGYRFVKSTSIHWVKQVFVSGDLHHEGAVRINTDFTCLIILFLLGMSVSI